MITELLNGYYIESSRTGSFTLKKRYDGMRNGVKAECSKLISYHREFKDAARAFLELFQGDKTDKSYKRIEDYVNDLIRANTEAVDAIQKGNMYRFFVNKPVARGHTEECRSIVDLIPVGRENAISRKALVQLCVSAGLVSDKLTPEQQDRCMRRLVEAARRDHTILNLSNGVGYYQVSHDDLLDLQRYIRQEESRAKATFRNLTMAKKLYEDFKVGRL